jgi:hypothetical protein
MDAVVRHTVPRLRAYVNLLTPSKNLFAAGGSLLMGRLFNAAFKIAQPKHTIYHPRRLDDRVGTCGAS